jgi:hypothetical protein
VCLGGISDLTALDTADDLIQTRQFFSVLLILLSPTLQLLNNSGLRGVWGKAEYLCNPA